MNNKPRMFIGSSAESIAIADAVNVNLDHEVEIHNWKDGTFDLSSTTIDSLVKKSQNVDFSLFIFSPDDIISIRGSERLTVRDNVLFELGLFIGALGKERCFILKPRGVELHLPTDLLGITCADYEPNRSDNSLSSAVNAACTQMKELMFKLGVFKRSVKSVAAAVLPEADVLLSDFDFNMLSSFLCTMTDTPNGVSLWQIKKSIKDHRTDVDLAVIKLERVGHIERSNRLDSDSLGYEHEYYVYKLSDSGLNWLMKNYSTKSKLASANSDLDDEIPF